MREPLASVVIPTRNRSALLRRVLESLREQSASPHEFEVIVVDNGSTDDTQEVCLRMLGRLPNLTVITEDRPGLHMGRQTGVDSAGGDLVIYGDDDITPAASWVEAIIGCFQNPDVGIVTGPCLPDYETEPPDWLEQLKVEVPGGWYVGEFSLMDLGPHNLDIDPGLAFGCNFGIRKDLVKSLGGFHPDALPASLLRFRGDGETALAQRVAVAGYRVLYEPMAAVAHFVSEQRMTMDYIRKRSFAEGVSWSFGETRSGESSGVRYTYRQVKAAVGGILTKSQVVRVRRRERHRGYKWHQQQMRRDPSVRAWVRQDDYMDRSGDLSAAQTNAVTTT